MATRFCVINVFDIRVATGSRVLHLICSKSQNITCNKIFGRQQKIFIFAFFHPYMNLLVSKNLVFTLRYFPFNWLTFSQGVCSHQLGRRSSYDQRQRRWNCVADHSPGQFLWADPRLGWSDFLLYKCDVSWIR